MQNIRLVQKYFLLIVIAFVFYSCRNDRVEKNDRYTFEIAGTKREYLLHIPKKLNDKAPLVFVLHGYGDSAEGIRAFTKMDSIADQNGFAVCYPEAVVGDDSLRSWNVGYSNYEIDDVGYLSALVTFLQKEYRLSAKNTFCTGMSNGGDMTIQMACLQPSLFKAVAPDVGCLMYWLADSMKIDEIAPIMMINGTEDDITLWKGEKDYPAIGPNGYMGTRQMVDTFVKLNACEKVRIDTLADINKSDSSFVVREKHIDCKNGKQVHLYALIGGGHDWPGAWGNMDFSASEVIWHFFEQYIE